MDVATLNDVGITLCAILGMAIFYWVGKQNSRRKHADQEESQDTSREHEAAAKSHDARKGPDKN